MLSTFCDGLGGGNHSSFDGMSWPFLLVFCLLVGSLMVWFLAVTRQPAKVDWKYAKVPTKGGCRCIAWGIAAAAGCLLIAAACSSSCVWMLCVSCCSMHVGVDCYGLRVRQRRLLCLFALPRDCMSNLDTCTLCVCSFALSTNGCCCTYACVSTANSHRTTRKCVTLWPSSLSMLLLLLLLLLWG